MTKKLRLLCYAIWGAFPLTLLLFLFVGLSDSTLPFTSRIENLHMILFGMGIAVTGISILISTKIYSGSDIYKNRFLLSLLTKKGIPQIGDANFSLYFSMYILSLALAETCSLWGMVGFIIKGNFSFFGIMTGLALIGWAMAFPKLVKLEKIFQTP